MFKNKLGKTPNLGKFWPEHAPKLKTLLKLYYHPGNFGVVVILALYSIAP